jgi:uncharacterized protein (TIGR04255 family)
VQGLVQSRLDVNLLPVTTPTPKFHRPPVAETLLGVQFAPLTSFGLAHLGLFWHGIRRDYPYQEVYPPLSPIIEQFGRPTPTGTTKIEIGLPPEPEARCWFIDSHRTELMQIQRDRFIRNWRKAAHDESYPSYEALRPKFERDWRRFLDFLDGEELGRPEVNQCEVTYINHLPVSDDLDWFRETRKAVTVLSDPSRQFLPAPEMIRFAYQYLLPDKQGRLYVALQAAVRNEDGSPILQLALTARGRPSSSRAESVMDWLDIGHEWVVRGFTDVTTSHMHEQWGRY